MTLRLPHPLQIADNLGLPIWPKPFSANMIVERGRGGLPGEWDGLLTYAWTERETGGWYIRTWPCATRPGRHYLRDPMNPLGTALLEPGRHKQSHRRGLHKGRPALVQVNPVTVRRDRDQDALLEPGKDLYVGLFGVNIHDISDPDYLAGCIGLRHVHLEELLAVYDRIAAREQQRDVSLTLVET